MIRLSKQETFPSPDHVVRRHWKKALKKPDPIKLAYVECVSFAALQYGTLLVVITLIYIIHVLGSGSRPGFTVLFLGTGAIALLLSAMPLAYLQTHRQFFEQFKAACRILELEPQGFSATGEARLKNLAHQRLQSLAKALQAVEEQYPPFSRERESSKLEFTSAYNCFRILGLIENVGYGPYFH